MNRAVAVAILALLAGLIAACAATPPDPRLAAELSRLPYPAQAERGEPLDIVARQRRGTLELSNRTARSYEGVQLWLNQQYVARVERVEAGPEPGRNRFWLGRFVNEHRERYPVGGLLTPDKGFPVVLVELFDPLTGVMHPLLARPELQRR